MLERKLLPQDVTLKLSQHQGWGVFIQTFKKRFGLVKHSTAHEIATAMGEEYFRGYYVFTFCRNPFARAYSAFRFTVSADAKHRPESERYQAIKDMTFEEFLLSSYMQDKRIFQARPQSEWIKNAPSKVHIFKLENLESELRKLSVQFYGSPTALGNVPHLNKSTDREEWKDMSPEAEKIITALYREDFELLGYPTFIDRIGQRGAAQQ